MLTLCAAVAADDAVDGYVVVVDLQIWYLVDVVARNKDQIKIANQKSSVDVGGRQMQQPTKPFGREL